MSSLIDFWNSFFEIVCDLLYLFKKYSIKFDFLDVSLVYVSKDDFSVDIHEIVDLFGFEVLEEFLSFLRLCLSEVFFNLFCFLFEEISIHVEVINGFVAFNLWVCVKNF